MWNDGPAKQPWLNYFNEYERTHCCFGDDDSDVGAADDESFNTSKQGTATQSTTSDISDVGASGMSADQAQAVSDAIDEAEKAGKAAGVDPDELNQQMQNIAEGGNRAAEAGYTGQDLQTVAAANIDTDFFSPDNTYGIGAGSISGVGSFADPFSDSGVGQTSFGSYVSDLETAAKGLASVSSIGVLSDLISNIAKEKGKPESEVTQAEINAVTSGVGPNAGIGEFSPSAAQTAVATGLESVGPGFNQDMAAGFGDRDTAISYGMLEDMNQRVTDLVSDLQQGRKDKQDKADQRGYGDAALAVTSNRPGDITDITDAQLAVGYDTAFKDYSRAMAEAQKAERDKAAPSISPDALSTDRELSYVEGVGYIDKGAVNDLISGRDRGTATYDSAAGFGDVPGYSSPTMASLQTGFGDVRGYSSPTELENITSAYEEAGRARSREGNQLGRDIAAYEEAENAMFGGRYAGTDYTPTIGPFEEIQGDEPIILPKKKEEEKEEPKSAMTQYFERLGVPSPYAPSTTQSTSPYLSAVASQPAGAPEDLFARMARIRRQEALKTPKFNYTGFAPFSPNLYAAVYGISPEEARLRIPALPTLKQTIGLPDEDDEDETTEAYGGGGLRNLIRRQTGGPTFNPEQTARELQKLRIAQLGTAPQTAAERQALQKQKGFYRDDEGMVRDAQGNVQENFGLSEGFPIGDEPKTLIDDEIKTMFLTTEDKQVLPIDVQEPGDPLYEPLPKIPDNVTTLPTFQPPGIEEGTGGPMIEQQPQPTGLQGLGQNLQPFGMQSPAPFGTQQPFSSGFGGFGQQPNFNTYSDIRSANSYNPAMGIK